MENDYYHMFANGVDSPDFIISETDFAAAFNRMGICAANNNVIVLAFSIEESHPHSLLYGSRQECLNFSKMYEDMTLRYVRASRHAARDIFFRCSVLKVENIDYLRNVGTYILVQPTKDGKQVMPYNYKWGTGSMYFKSDASVPPWIVGKNMEIVKPVKFSELSYREKRSVLRSRKTIPDHWQVCQGLILPSNYVNVKLFEDIYRTCNCFRVFLSAGKNRSEEIVRRMMDVTGVTLDDLEARRICSEVCYDKFGISKPHTLSVEDRLSLAWDLHVRHKLSIRQVASLVNLPDREIRKFK